MIVLGLVVDNVGCVRYGEVVDPHIQGRHRFVGLDGIPDAVRSSLREVLISQPRDESSLAPGPTDPVA